MNSISIVKVNEARLIVNLTRILATQTEATPLDISEVRDLRVRLIPRCGSSIDLQASAYTNSSSIMVTIPVLPCGTYSMEITGTRNLLRIASRELCVLRIVYDNSLATVPSGEIEGSKSYDIDITMVLYTERAYDIDEEVTEDGKNAPRTSAVHKALQMYGEAAQQTAEELEVMQNNVNELAEGVSDVVESEVARVKAEQKRTEAEEQRTLAFAETTRKVEEAAQNANDAAARANESLGGIDEIPDTEIEDIVNSVLTI